MQLDFGNLGFQNKVNLELISIWKDPLID